LRIIAAFDLMIFVRNGDDSEFVAKTVWGREKPEK
jgi:hypothetical protein